jgi:hypothetical protein
MDALVDSFADGGEATWRVPAAYLYTLALDPVGLAWEYLRRNDNYCAAWAKRAHTGGNVDTWSLRAWEDPRQDSRNAEPLWRTTPCSSVWIIPAPAREASACFELWRVRGRKTLIHNGSGIQLTARRGYDITRAVLDPGLTSVEPYAYQIPAGGGFNARCRAVNEFERTYGGRPGPRADSRPDRSAVLHSRILLASDGARSGASHRQVAIALFGQSVVQEQWSPDGELRAQVRYLVKRGQALIGGGYRSLLNPDTS